MSEPAGRLNDGAASISAAGNRIRLLMVLAVLEEDDYVFDVFAAESAGADGGGGAEIEMRL